MKHSPITTARITTSTINPITNAMYKISVLLSSVLLLGGVGLPDGDETAGREVERIIVEFIIDFMAVSEVVVGVILSATVSNVLVEGCVDFVTVMLSSLMEELVVVTELCSVVGPECVHN